MKKNDWVIWIGAVVVIAFIVLIWRSAGGGANPQLDNFASCLKDKGAIFYGAFWCPHCANQKKLFGSAVKFLPYVECSTPDGNNQTEICKANRITSYPTWVFADHSTSTGEQSLESLAQKTSCPLPGSNGGSQATTSP